MSSPTYFNHRLSQDIDRAVDVLRRGGLVALPTETVYGLGVDASNPTALRKLYEVKGRPSQHPVIVHLGSLDQLPDWTMNIPETAIRLGEACWPGPLTMILPKAAHVPDEVTGGQATVGIRIPNHPLTLELLKAFQGGVAAPSANRFGRISPTLAEHVLEDLGDQVDLVLDGGPCTVGVESTIVDLCGPVPVLLRPGHFQPEQIAEILGVEIKLHASLSPNRAPGMLPSHYAPMTPLQLVLSAELPAILEQACREDLRIAVLARETQPIDHPNFLWHRAPQEPERYARQLYATLRMLDATRSDRIVIEALPEQPAWDAVRDRLSRAAAKPVSQGEH